MQYYYLKTTEKNPSVTPDFFNIGPLPLIWMHEGFFSLIPRETVANFLDHAADIAKERSGNCHLHIQHCCSMNIDTPLGRALAPEEELDNHPGNNSTNRKLNGPVSGEVVG